MESETWWIGGAEVRLVPMPSPLGRRTQEFKRNWLYGPFAYPPNGIAEYRAQWIKAQTADLRARQTELALRERAGGGGTRRLSRAGLRLRALGVKIHGTWVNFRRHQMVAAQRRRRRLSGPIDRLGATYWRIVLGARAWRRLEPRLWDFELTFGPIVDQLEPDLIHAHDFYMLGVGARAAQRARLAGRDTKLIWDAHELVSGLKARSDNVRWLPAHIAHEREYAPYADAAMTVSDELADVLLRVHKLPQRPTVILNAPSVEEFGVALLDYPNLRDLCDIGPDVPLVVYSGAAAHQRGLDTMVEALKLLPGVHVAFVVLSPGTKYVQGLIERATALGVGDRLHVMPYVTHSQVVAFLAAADVGAIPIHHWPNHEIALITKFFEYAHARLPMVVSDVRTMAAMTRKLGQGEVFKADDVADFARAVRLVLADPERYRRAYETPGLLDQWTWEAQAEVLDGVYSALLPDRGQCQPSDPWRRLRLLSAPTPGHDDSGWPSYSRPRSRSGVVAP
jgi:glycogen(starch) synthase